MLFTNYIPSYVPDLYKSIRFCFYLRFCLNVIVYYNISNILSYYNFTKNNILYYVTVILIVFSRQELLVIYIITVIMHN